MKRVGGQSSPVLYRAGQTSPYTTLSPVLLSPVLAHVLLLFDGLCSVPKAAACPAAPQPISSSSTNGWGHISCCSTISRQLVTWVLLLWGSGWRGGAAPHPRPRSDWRCCPSGPPPCPPPPAARLPAPSSPSQSTRWAGKASKRTGVRWPSDGGTAMTGSSCAGRSPGWASWRRSCTRSARPGNRTQQVLTGENPT